MASSAMELFARSKKLLPPPKHFHNGQGAEHSGPAVPRRCNFGRTLPLSAVLKGVGSKTVSRSETQTIDQSRGFRQIDESFDQTFSKVCGVKGEKPLSPSAEGEIPSFGVSFGQTLRSRFAAEQREAFASFFAPTRSKKKRTNVFVQFLFDMPFVDNLRPRQPCRLPRSFTVVFAPI